MAQTYGCNYELYDADPPEIFGAWTNIDTISENDTLPLFIKAHDNLSDSIWFLMYFVNLNSNNTLFINKKFYSKPADSLYNIKIAADTFNVSGD